MFARNVISKSRCWVIAAIVLFSASVRWLRCSSESSTDVSESIVCPRFRRISAMPHLHQREEWQRVADGA